jgi:AraC-like DNA-binding protein
VVGVHFRPGGAFPLLGVSPAELVDSCIEIDDVWGTDGRNLRDQLLEASSALERLQLLEAALLRRLRDARTGHPAARVALEAFRSGGSDLRVAEIANRVGLSHRGFIEVFEREVGLTPKLFARLQRFHRAKRQLAASGGPPSWAAFAVDCGYFDQSHMIRDFVSFTGISPTSYLRSRADETLFDHLVHAYRSPGEGAAKPHNARYTSKSR